jgi:hypothetical protein
MIDTGNRGDSVRAEIDASKIVIGLARGGMLGGAVDFSSDSRTGEIEVEDDMPLLAD